MKYTFLAIGGCIASASIAAAAPIMPRIGLAGKHLADSTQSNPAKYPSNTDIDDKSASDPEYYGIREIHPRRSSSSHDHTEDPSAYDSDEGTKNQQDDTAKAGRFSKAMDAAKGYETPPFAPILPRDEGSSRADSVGASAGGSVKFPGGSSHRIRAPRFDPSVKDSGQNKQEEETVKGSTRFDHRRHRVSENSSDKKTDDTPRLSKHHPASSRRSSTSSTGSNLNIDQVV